MPQRLYMCSRRPKRGLMTHEDRIDNSARRRRIAADAAGAAPAHAHTLHECARRGCAAQERHRRQRAAARRAERRQMAESAIYIGKGAVGDAGEPRPPVALEMMNICPSSPAARGLPASRVGSARVRHGTAWGVRCVRGRAQFEGPTAARAFRPSRWRASRCGSR